MNELMQIYIMLSVQPSECLSYSSDFHPSLRLAQTPWYKFLVPQRQRDMLLQAQLNHLQHQQDWPLLLLLPSSPLLLWRRLLSHQLPLLQQLPLLPSLSLNSLSLRLQPQHLHLPLHLSR